jgi:hypothetical protein
MPVGHDFDVHPVSRGSSSQRERGSGRFRITRTIVNSLPNSLLLWTLSLGPSIFVPPSNDNTLIR